MQTVTLDRPTLPVLYRCDVAVAGGSFGGVAAALALARAGRQVLLVEPRTYLGREITATLRPWVRAPAGAGAAPLPELIEACVEASGTSPVGGEYPLHMDAVKIRLEDVLLTAGVRLLYASLPMQVLAGQGGAWGLVIGNKSGRQVVRCRLIIDATETALVARLAGARFDPEPGTALFGCTLEYEGVAPLAEADLSVPAELGLAGDRVTLHAGYRGPGHLLLECELALPGRSDCAFAITQREVAARRKMASLAEHLAWQVPAFAGAYLGGSSHELCGPQAPCLGGSTPAWAPGLDCVSVGAGGRASRVPLSCFTGSLPGLWCLNGAARVDDALRTGLRDALTASRVGSAVGLLLAQRWGAASVPGRAEPAGVPLAASTAGCALQLKEPAQPQRGRRYERCPVDTCSVPIAGTVHVLVAGGGSSGAVAAITVAREGLRTTLLDMNPGLGGTGTYGGIRDYWFGQRTGFVARLKGWLDRMHDRLRLPRPEGALARWNTEARAWALMEEAQEAGVAMLLNGLVVGAIVEGSAVRGVVAATRVGPVALLGQVVVDATGDGDVAAFAGAECVYGSEREHAAMYAYMSQIEGPGHPRNVKTSMVDVSNVEDYTRMILAERRRRQEGDHDHGIYLAPRESRHVEGDVVLTLTDQLLRRCWPDVAYVAFSNHDIKGESTSDWIRIGLQPPNLEIEIPYRALLPRGIENILVVGKAFSATHDALAAPRMQPDLENLGGVAALAAAAAVRSGKAPRDVDIGALQGRLVEAGALPERVLRRALAPLHYADGELARLVDSLDAERPLHAYSDMEIGERYDGRIPLVDILCAGPRVVPLLEEALARSKGRRWLLLARMLALLGSQASAPVLVSAIDGLLAAGRLPGRDDPVRFAGRPPDQGAAPLAAHLVHALGLTRDPCALPVWRRVVDLLAGATPEEILDPQQCLYYYVTAVCYGAERLGDPAAAPLLRQLHGYPPFRQRVSAGGFEPDYLQERRACLELLIGRALARCGSPEGAVILIDYLEDTRALLAEHAHSELIAVSGQDLGKDMAAWGQWLEAVGDSLQPAPALAPTDPMAAWGEEILRAAGDSERQE